MGASWETPQQAPIKPDVAILTPTRGFVFPEWAISFKALQVPNVTIHTERFLPIDISRNQLTQAGLNDGAKRLFFLDDDVVMPYDGLLKLIDLQDMIMKDSPKAPSGFPVYGPVLSGLYYAKKLLPDGRFHESHPAAWKKSQDNPIAFGPIDMGTNDGANIECDVIGAGCMLVVREVFEKLPKPWFKWRVHEEEKGDKVSEDFHFNLMHMQHLGIKPVVATSIKCDHLATTKIRGSDGKMTLQVM